MKLGALPLYPRERTGTFCIGGWVGRRAGLGGYRKFHIHRDSFPQTVKSVASRYIDYAIPFHTQYGVTS
jgi:hypothetical protein